MNKNYLIFLPKILFLFLFLFLFFCFSLFAGVKYKGSLVLYTLFCIAFCILIIDALRGKKFFSYIYFVLFLFLGFWAKFILHLIIPYPYLEPVGDFDYSDNSWDLVLTVSLVGVLAIVLSKNLFLRVFYKSDAPLIFYAPTWYAKNRLKILSLLLLSICLLPFLNIYFGIAQAGIIPSIRLPWPVNGLVAWCLGFGLALAVATIIYWDRSLNKSVWVGFIFLIVEGFFSTISSLSRAAYIFHSVPTFYLLIKEYAFVRWYEKFISLLIWLIFLVTSLILVMMLRYSDLSPIDASNTEKFNMQGATFVTEISKRVSRLLVDRWIGLEGVMAVVSYPDKNITLLKEAMMERRETGKVDIYTLKIAKAGLTHSDLEKFQYATIPGLIAFFYYSNSYIILFFGVFLLVLLMMFLEKFVFCLTKNKYLTAFWGMGAAQAVASFGLGLPQQLLYYSVCFFAIFFIYLVQKFSRSAINA